MSFTSADGHLFLAAHSATRTECCDWNLVGSEETSMEVELPYFVRLLGKESGDMVIVNAVISVQSTSNIELFKTLDLSVLLIRANVDVFDGITLEKLKLRLLLQCCRPWPQFLLVVCQGRGPTAFSAQFNGVLVEFDVDYAPRHRNLFKFWILEEMIRLVRLVGLGYPPVLSL